MLNNFSLFFVELILFSCFCIFLEMLIKNFIYPYLESLQKNYEKELLRLEIEELDYREKYNEEKVSAEKKFNEMILIKNKIELWKTALEKDSDKKEKTAKKFFREYSDQLDVQNINFQKKKSFDVYKNDLFIQAKDTARNLNTSLCNNLALKEINKLNSNIFISKRSNYDGI